jgi:hypothetical protein
VKYDPEIRIVVHEETIPLRGNALASGDDDLDRDVEEEILSRLAYGEQWAWCWVEVIAEFRGLEGRDTLGGCSYKDEADFKENSGYYEDMVARATDELADLVEGLQGCEIRGVR